MIFKDPTNILPSVYILSTWTRAGVEINLYNSLAGATEASKAFVRDCIDGLGPEDLPYDNEITQEDLVNRIYDDRDSFPFWRTEDGWSIELVHINP